MKVFNFRLSSYSYYDLGTVICRASYNSLTKEYKFLYILGGLNKEKIVCSLNQEEISKIIMNDEKDVLFGNVNLSFLQFIYFSF